MRKLLGLSMGFCLLITGCINHAGDFNNNNKGDVPVYPNIEQCYTNPTAPAGYIRIDSKQELSQSCPQQQPNQLNILIFAPYTNIAVKSTLLVCADQPIPSGWADISGGFHDASGCDASAHPDTGFANERKIYRTQ